MTYLEKIDVARHLREMSISMLGGEMELLDYKLTNAVADRPRLFGVSEKYPTGEQWITFHIRRAREDSSTD